MVLWQPPKMGDTGPSLKGQYYSFKRNGRWYVQAWPKKPIIAPTQKQLEARQSFANCTVAMKHTAAEVQMYYREAAKGTPMLPRDAFMAALYGNGPSIRFYNGKVLKPMANKLLASTVLDAIWDAPGTILVRGPDTWQPLLPGEDGWALVTHGPGQLPTWEPVGGGGGERAYFYPSPGGLSGSAHCSKGIHARFVEAWSITKFYFEQRAATGDKLNIRVFYIDDDGYITHTALDMNHAATGNDDYQYEILETPYPVAIPAGQRFCVLISTDGKPDNFVTRILTGSLDGPSFPVYPGFGYSNTTIANPIIGDRVGTSNGSPYFVGLGLV